MIHLEFIKSRVIHFWKSAVLDLCWFKLRSSCWLGFVYLDFYKVLKKNCYVLVGLSLKSLYSTEVVSSYKIDIHLG